LKFVFYASLSYTVSRPPSGGRSR